MDTWGYVLARRDLLDPYRKLCPSYCVYSRSGLQGRTGRSIIERKTGPERNVLFLIDLDSGKLFTYLDRQPDYNTFKLGGI